MVVTNRRQLSAVSKIYIWLPPSEYFNLSEIKLLIPEWVFSEITSEGKVCVHWNRNSTNGSIVENVFLNELVLSRRYDECLCQSLQIIVFYGNISEHVHCLFVIIILETNTTSVKRTIQNLKTDIGVVTNHVKTGSNSSHSQSNFHIWIDQFRSWEKVNPQFAIQYETVRST